MSVGLPVTHSDLNVQAGTIALDMLSAANRVRQLQDYLEATPDQDLVDLGFSAADVTVIKSAFTDLDAVVSELRGRLTFIRQLIGIRTY